MSRARRSLARVFALPAAVAIVTLAALVAGLVGEGRWDGLAWFGLAVPLVAARNAIRWREVFALRRHCLTRARRR